MPDEVVVNLGDPAPSSPTARPRRPNAGRSGPRASVACVSCRQKKTKCDAQNARPGTRCTACRTSDIECVLIRNDDRRKYGSRQHIASLQSRIRSIEALISDYQKGSQEEQLGRRSDRMTSADPSEPFGDSEGEETPVTNQAMALGNLEDTERAQTPVSLNEMTANMASQGEEMDALLYDQDHAESTVVAVGSDPLPHLADGDVQFAQKEGGFSVFLAFEDDTPSLDASSSPGEVHYYGPTTQLHIKSPVENKIPPQAASKVDTEFVVDMDSQQLRRLLLQSCWAYYSWSVPVVDEELFTSHRKLGTRSQYYSSFLENCLLACATRISTSPGVRKLGRAYADRAKQEVVLELEHPTLASLAGFLLLSDFEATNSRDRAGWIYCEGIACRLLYDLGAHEDCQGLVNRGILSQSDLRMRSLLLLSAFVYDKAWALYLGRPSCIPVGILDISAQRSIESAFDNRTLSSWVELSRRISEVAECLNGPHSTISRHRVEELLQVDTKIVNSYDLIPRETSSQHCQMSELDQTAYGLNIQFLGIRIVVHRAIIRILSKQKPPVSSDCLRVEKSRAIMHENAVSISRLILAYREIFGTESFITIMLDNMYIAASTIISHIVQPPTTYSSTPISDDLSLLRVLAESMESAQRHYPVAEKMRRTLSRITRNKELGALFGKPQPDDAGAFGPNSSKNLEQPSCLPNAGSWGSMEALLSDDVILGHNDMFLNTASPSHDPMGTTFLGGNY